MLKIFVGAHELPLEYYFNYKDNNTAYNKRERVVTGKLALKNVSEAEKLAFLKQWNKDMDITIVEGKQVGYMVNQFHVREVLYSDLLDSGEALFEVTLVRRMAPRMANTIQQVDITNQTLANLTATVLIAVDIEKINTGGNIFFLGSKFLKVTDTPNASAPYEVGRCRATTGSSFYITQGGASNVKFIYGHGNVPFPDGKITVGVESDQEAKITGKVLIITNEENKI